ncbi:MAG: respiratory chain complex I subunit 1 family protein [Chitinophagales bacterium]
MDNVATQLVSGWGVAFVRGAAQAGLFLLLAPGVNGAIKRFKAALQNRRGPSVVQPYRDLDKLFRKEAVISRHASWVVRVAPYVTFAAYLSAGLQLPLLGSASMRPGAFLTFIYLLALGRVAMALAALDTGSNFGGMGASRELAVSVLVEPALFLSLAGLAFDHGVTSRPLAAAAFAVAAIAEMGRIPVDNPDTHLELTMIHEGMLLEYSGRHLALLTWAAQVKQLLMLTLLASLFLGPWPAGVGGLVALAFPLYLVKVVLLGLGFGLVEFLFAKMRFFRLPRLLGASFLLAALSVSSALFLRG